MSDKQWHADQIHDAQKQAEAANPAMLGCCQDCFLATTAVIVDAVRHLIDSGDIARVSHEMLAIEGKPPTPENVTEAELDYIVGTAYSMGLSTGVALVPMPKTL